MISYWERKKERMPQRGGRNIEAERREGRVEIKGELGRGKRRRKNSPFFRGEKGEEDGTRNLNRGKATGGGRKEEKNKYVRR